MSLRALIVIRKQDVELKVTNCLSSRMTPTVSDVVLTKLDQIGRMRDPLNDDHLILLSIRDSSARPRGIGLGRNDKRGIATARPDRGSE